MPLPRLVDLGELVEGTPLPERSLAPDIMDVARFIGAAGFAIPIFLDPVAARTHGLERPLIPAEYKSAFLLAYLRALAKPDGRVVRLQSGFRRPDYHGNRFTIGGQVTRIEEVEGGREVNLELWIEQATGDRSVRSSAVLLLPNAES